MERMIATSRLKAFFEQWLADNWVDDGTPRKPGDRRGIGLLAFRAGTHERRIFRVFAEEVPNTSFDFVDSVFVNLDCIHLWHTPPEHGGFSDYYQDEIPEPEPESALQERRRVTNSAKRAANKSGRPWMDILHDQALREIAA